MGLMGRLATACILATTLTACSFGIVKPPDSYKPGLAPDCNDDVVPPVLDLILISVLAYIVVPNDRTGAKGFGLCKGALCKGIAAGVVLSVPVFAFVRGTTRVWRCRKLNRQHDDFVRQQQARPVADGVPPRPDRPLPDW